MTISTHVPVFVDIGSRTINASQIKWVGVQQESLSSDVERVHIEFVNGGYIQLERGITLGQFRTALDDALQAADPF